MRKLDGKTAIVSGSGRGIGRSIALKLAAEGANVVVNDLDNDPAEAVVEEITKAGGNAVICAGNVTAEGFGERFVGTATSEFGGLDIIINNAGLGGGRTDEPFAEAFRGDVARADHRV